MEKVKYKDYLITIKDDDAESPNAWMDENRILVYDHRQFTVDRKGFEPMEIFQAMMEPALYKGYHVFPLYAYIHSGVSLSLTYNGDRWDTSMKGFILIKDGEEGVTSREEALKPAEDLVELWNSYLEGSYWFNIKNPEGDEIDSCGGFYGYDHEKSGLMDTCRDAIDNDINTVLHNKEQDWQQQKQQLNDSKQEFMEYFEHYVNEHTKL